MVGLVLALLVVLTMSSVVSADAVFDGKGGPPIAMGSNPGSEAGNAHRSAQGTWAKFTYDGYTTHPPFLD